MTDIVQVCSTHDFGTENIRLAISESIFASHWVVFHCLVKQVTWYESQANFVTPFEKWRISGRFGVSNTFGCLTTP
jgi:hypothetical protein